MTLSWGRTEAATRSTEDATPYWSDAEYGAMKHARARRRKAMGYSRAVAAQWVEAGARENAKQERENAEA